MVTRAAVNDLLISYFDVDDAYEIGDDLRVNTSGSVSVRARGDHVFPKDQLPIKFGHVAGDFDVVITGLTTLEGAPHTVGGTFMCGANKLTTLEHGPSKVGYMYVMGGNPLVSLAGFPTQVAPEEVSLMYVHNLPLLRLLSCNHIRMYPPMHDATLESQQKVDLIVDIMNKYTGQGKPGAIRAAAELIRAGFKENARW
jgi:hypothetical protein